MSDLLKFLKDNNVELVPYLETEAEKLLWDRLSKLKEEIKRKDLIAKELEFNLDVFGGWLIEKNCPTSVLNKFREARKLSQKEDE